ncbi:hypothetical protein QOZ98_001627 [Planomicrobium stackebrandtii]|uniref:Uncharacterized protein n=1 Tax=Planomicrobium stackebrandtii TaxID=253160 RepID=A0ABU0GW75_9BACL|nr:hypothetical protein [Planomicrobium stackebrandtii]MDQ0428800.1 hypothetical protein [Planomicrobium stackebrandtii]
MDFLNAAYPQSTITKVLNNSGINLNGTIAMPWPGDQSILLDSTGNALGYMTQNQMGGVTVTDAHMGVQSVSAELPGGGQSIMDATYNQQAFTVENTAVADMTYTNDFQLESMSFDSSTGETAYYSSDMELLGITEQLGDSTQYNFNGSLNENSLPTLTDYVSGTFAHGSDAASVLGGELLMDFDMDSLDAGLGIFEWL